MVIYRKISNTQYDILKSIKIDDEVEEDTDSDLNTKEKTIVDLIQDIQKNSKTRPYTTQFVNAIEWYNNNCCYKKHKKPRIKTNPFTKNKKKSSSWFKIHQ